MKYYSRLLLIACLVFGLAGCTDVLTPKVMEADEIPVQIRFSLADKSIQTKSKVSGTETVVTSMQLVCFDARGQYLGIRDAEVTSNSASDEFFDTGLIDGTVPPGTSRIHFIANRSLTIPLSFAVGTAESTVMNSFELSTAYNDEDHQKICYWGYHKEDNAEAMAGWLTPEKNADPPHIVYLIRDRAKVVLSYDNTGAKVPVTKIEWLIHNGRERGYLAPAETNWSNNGYYGNSTMEGHTSELISTAGIHEYKTSGRYKLYDENAEPPIDDTNNFDVAYQSSGTYTAQPQFLFDDDNADIDNVKVIMRVTYTVTNEETGQTGPKSVYHVLRLNKKDPEKPDDPAELYDIVRNNTYYINCKLLSPDVAFYETLKDAVNGNEFVNADVEVDRTIPDINDETYTLQIKLPGDGTSIVLNTEGVHNEMHFVYRLASNVNTEGSTNSADFNVYWEKTQTFCSNPSLTYNSTTKQFEISTTVLEGKLTDKLQDEWIVVENKYSHLKRYIHVYVIDQFRYKIQPTLKAVSGSTDYVLSFQLPPMEHTQFLPDGTGDPNELVYPQTLYPIDVMFTTNTLNAYGITQGTNNYGLFGVSVESTEQLLDFDNFEAGNPNDLQHYPPYNDPISSTEDSEKTHWYFQQASHLWDFWYTYQLETYPTNGIVNIYFKDVRDHITYATVTDVGLFLYVKYFGKNYSVPVAN